MRAILVSVDYADLLGVTLPYNRHHFSEVTVVTTPKDKLSQQIAEDNNCELFCTNLFYDEGADFAKWRALEAGLDFQGRYGWLCIMDADVLWPKQLPDLQLSIGCLYTPLCWFMSDLSLPIPEEKDWDQYPIRRNQAEWAGYTQIFHANDPNLGNPPWHEIDWKHAGGADSFFQRKWSKEKKIRPPFKVMHLGQHGRNWCGRSTPYLDGAEPKEGADRFRKLRNYIKNRRKGLHIFDHEKIQPNRSK